MNFCILECICALNLKWYRSRKYGCAIKASNKYDAVSTFKDL